MSESSVGALHRRVERDGGGLEVGAPDERERVRRPPLPLHSRVLPLDRERPRIADPVEPAEERLEVDVAVPGRDEVPPARRLAEVQVRAEDALPAIERLPRVLDMDVVDPLRELLGERGGVEKLVREVARVEVDPERLPVVDRIER